MKIVNEFKALSDETRLRIINILLENNLCVCEIMDVLEMTQSRISRHMGILKQAELIEEERNGKWVIYKIAEKNKSILSYVKQQTKNEQIFNSDKEKIEKTLIKELCPVKH